MQASYHKLPALAKEKSQLFAHETSNFKQSYFLVNPLGEISCKMNSKQQHRLTCSLELFDISQLNVEECLPEWWFGFWNSLAQVVYWIVIRHYGQLAAEATFFVPDKKTMLLTHPQIFTREHGFSFPKSSFTLLRQKTK